MGSNIPEVPWFENAKGVEIEEKIKENKEVFSNSKPNFFPAEDAKDNYVFTMTI